MKRTMTVAVAVVILFSLMSPSVFGECALEIIGSVDTPPSARRVTVSGDHAYVADLDSGLQIIDVSNPTSPFIVGSVAPLSFTSANVAVSGNYAYVADWWGLQIVDVSIPTAPSTVGSCASAQNCQRVAVSGNSAYIGDIYGLQVIDVSNPTTPTVVASFDFLGGVTGLVASGSLVYVGTFGPLYVIDASDPSSPQIIGSCNPWTPTALDISGSFLYVAAGSHGFQVVDISDPSAPALVGSLGITGYIDDVAVAGSYAYLADINSTIPPFARYLRIVDISDPTNPYLVANFDTPGSNNGVAVSGDYVYVADGHVAYEVSALQILPQCVSAGGITVSGFVLEPNELVGISGVLMSGLPGNPVTDIAGFYSAEVPSGWSGTVTPTKTGFVFTPPSRTYTDVTANQLDQNYSGLTVVGIVISGHVLNSNELGISGVLMNGLPGNPVTDTAGFYSAEVPSGWSGTVTPTKKGFAFTPPSITYTDVTSDQLDQNYSGTKKPATPSWITYPAVDSDGKYTVNWGKATRATSYELRRSNNGGVTWRKVYVGSNRFYNETVGNGKYRYKVRATNAAGSSAWRVGTTDCVVTIP